MVYTTKYQSFRNVRKRNHTAGRFSMVYTTKYQSFKNVRKRNYTAGERDYVIYDVSQNKINQKKSIFVWWVCLAKSCLSGTVLLRPQDSSDALHTDGCYRRKKWRNCGRYLQIPGIAKIFIYWRISKIFFLFCSFSWVITPIVIKIAFRDKTGLSYVYI